MSSSIAITGNSNSSNLVINSSNGVITLNDPSNCKNTVNCAPDVISTASASNLPYIIKELTKGGNSLLEFQNNPFLKGLF
jgi:hypothetical protein